MENPSNYNLAVPSTHLVYSEILSVTSAMRKNSRWATPAAYYPTSAPTSFASSLGLRTGLDVQPTPNKPAGRRDFDLMFGFEELKRNIRATSGKSEE
jgi:brefeldin A-resistance guanine nucleotide exchange factor 1